MSAKKKGSSSMPTTFQEKHRSYSLDILREGRIGATSSTAEGCLSTIVSLADGATFLLVARYKNDEIGRATYRKRGPAGRVTTVETLEASGALIGFIEAELEKREAVRQTQEQAERAARLIHLTCPAGHDVGYDPTDGQFFTLEGQAQPICKECGEILSLEALQHHHQQRIDALQKALQGEQEQLRLVRTLQMQHNKGETHQ